MKIFVLNAHGSILPTFFVPPSNMHIQPIVCVDETVNVNNIATSFYSKPVEEIYRQHIRKRRLPVTTASPNFPQYKIPQKYHKDAFFDEMQIELFPFYYSKEDPKDAIMFKVGLYELPVLPETVPEGIGKFEKDFFFDPALHEFVLEGRTVRDPKSMDSHVITPLTIWNRTKRTDIDFLPTISNAIRWASRHSTPIPKDLFRPHVKYLTGTIKTKSSDHRTYTIALDPRPLPPIPAMQNVLASNPGMHIIKDTNFHHAMMFNDTDVSIRLKKPMLLGVGDRVMIQYPNRTQFLLSDLVRWLGAKYPTESLYIFLFTCRAIAWETTPSAKQLITRLNQNATRLNRRRKRSSQQGGVQVEPAKKIKVKGFQQMTNIKQDKRALESLYNILIQVDNLYETLLKKHAGILSFFSKQDPKIMQYHRDIKTTIDTMASTIGNVHDRQDVILDIRFFKDMCKWIAFLLRHELTTPDLKKFLVTYCYIHVRKPTPPRSVAI